MATNKIIDLGLKPDYEMSQTKIGEALFMKQQTIQKIEVKAIENFKKALADRGIDIKDILE